MITRILVLLSLGCLVLFATWLVQGPRSVRADQIPEKYQITVHQGLEYLVKNQHKEGHWEGEGGRHPVATTALAGIALLMEGKWDNIEGRGTGIGKRKHAAEILRAADWLIQLSEKRKDGLIYSGHPSETASYMEGHGLATMFLAAAVCHNTVDAPDLKLCKKLQETLNRAIDCIVKARSTEGGWYFTSPAEGHDLCAILPTVIQIQALQAAHFDVVIRHSAVTDGKEYIRQALTKKGLGKDNVTETAAALASRIRGRMGKLTDKDEFWPKWLDSCRTLVPIGNKMEPGRDELTHYYYAQALFSLGGDSWKTYRSATFDHLDRTQKPDGSWPVASGLCPIRAAAMWCIVLQLDNKSHPTMRWPEDYMPVTSAELRRKLEYAHRPPTQFGSPAEYRPAAQARALS